MQRESPHGVGARHGDEEKSLVRGENEAVGADAVLNERVEFAGWGEAVDFSGGVGEAGLALVGEVEVAGGGEDEVVGALEALEIAARETGGYCAR